MKIVQIFLDIETNWDRQLTVFGFRSTDTGLVQLVGKEITRSRILKELPRSGRLYTYNGHCFDLPCITKQFRLDLRKSYDSWDLRWICQRHGIFGGQKAIEQQIGFERITEGIDGMEAIYLWERYLRGDEYALSTLLQYNAEDLDGVAAIRRHLEIHKLLTR